ncbi:ferritin-like domain-containing protein [Oecophyllibacter saccharovorans]|uniref:ferritin-like domain-containing protein n=1 Tax=Oecophyllibacter saccharovorans TaxID=2558360 RepID=UPI001E48BBA4|nr:ferritin-like domain-containing protein [Oecophyllibacter saccharovorans]
MSAKHHHSHRESHHHPHHDDSRHASSSHGHHESRSEKARKRKSGPEADHCDEEASRARLEQLYSHLPDAPSARTLEEVDFQARHWSSPVIGPLTPGSPEHKKATADMFRETFNPYKPSIIDWPELDPETRERITSLPIWDIAVHTEGRARLRMAAYAEMIEDPELRDAIARNAWEENRHKEVLSRMVEHYGIKLGVEPPYEMPKNPEWAYLVTGFSECWDSFFAFGLFAMAEKSGLFPMELVETFEPVMQEEARHILLFANWLAYHRTHLPLLKRLWFEGKVLAVLAYLFYERLTLLRTFDEDGNEHTEDFNFAVRGVESVTEETIDFVKLMELCLSENDRRFSGYDPRLLRPQLAPACARIALTAVRMWKGVFNKAEKKAERDGGEVAL